MPLYVFLIYYLYQRFQKRVLLIIVGLLIVILISDMTCAQILKSLFHRERPCHVLDMMPWYSDFDLCSDTYSFPSCHAMNHAAIAIFISPFFRRKYRIYLALWVLIIGYSQVYVGVHYPSDIVGGMAIGLGIGWIVFRMYNYILKKMNISQV